MSNVVTPTARFWRQVIIDLTVMSIVGLVLGLIGPFGSYADPLALRLIYWLGLSYAGYACCRPVSYFVLKAGQKLDLAEWGLWVMACLKATIPMSVIVWLIGFPLAPLARTQPATGAGDLCQRAADRQRDNGGVLPSRTERQCCGPRVDRGSTRIRAG